MNLSLSPSIWTRLFVSSPLPRSPVKFAVSSPAPPLKSTSVTAAERDTSTLAVSLPEPSETLSLPMGFGALPVFLRVTVSSPAPVSTSMPPLPAVWASTSTASSPRPVTIFAEPLLASSVSFTVSSPAPLSTVRLVGMSLLLPLMAAVTLSFPSPVSTAAVPIMTSILTVSSPSPVLTAAAPAVTLAVTASSPAPVSISTFAPTPAVTLTMSAASVPL